MREPFDPEQIDDIDILMRIAGAPFGPGMHRGPRGPHGPHGPHGPFGPHHGHHGPGPGGMTQMRILRILSEEGALSQRVLQEMLHVRPGSASEILTKLEERGLIARERDEEDRRRVMVRLTDEGRAAVTEAEERHAEHMRERYRMLTEEEQETLKTLLRKIIAGRRPEGPECMQTPEP